MDSCNSKIVHVVPYDVARPLEVAGGCSRVAAFCVRTAAFQKWHGTQAADIMYDTWPSETRIAHIRAVFRAATPRAPATPIIYGVPFEPHPILDAVLSSYGLPLKIFKTFSIKYLGYGGVLRCLPVILY